MRVRRKSEFDAFCARAVEAAEVVTAGLAANNQAALEPSYRSAIRFVFGIISTLIIDSRGIGPAGDAATAIHQAASDASVWESTHRKVTSLGKSTGLSLITELAEINLGPEYASSAIGILLAPSRDVILGLGYFDSIPSTWLSTLYEQMLALHPHFSDETPGVTLESDSRGRKRSGSFFTPPYLADYIVSKTVGRLDDPKFAKVLDPSMGPGHFLLQTLSFLSKKGILSAHVAENCLHGCDIDPIAVDVARFLVWMETFGEADAHKIAENLICTDALSDNFSWAGAFPDVFDGSRGFDAVIGNPPYVASKNGAFEDGGSPSRGRGQSDYYLQFMECIIRKRLVRSGGSFSMVLPDPFLVRSNAAHIRRKLLSEWTIDEVIHISGAFSGAQVANVVPISTNRLPDSSEFRAIRIDNLLDRRRFELDPHRIASKLAKRVNSRFALSQPGAEMLYLAGDGWQSAFQRIHGPEMSVSHISAPFVHLKDIGIEVLFRGEEIGKKAISEGDGELPILLGGESVRRYGINWEDHKISRESVAKPMEWYSGTKVLLQKSTGKLVAALDTEGFVVPQSVYGIKLREGRYHLLYLLALLNSRFLNEYVFRAFTGYKLVQPQLELEDIKRLPIRVMPFSMSDEERKSLADMGKRTYENGLSDRNGDFSELSKLVLSWLESEKDDAAHDLLVFLAGEAMTYRNTEQASRIDSAIDAVVDILYRAD